MKPISEYADWGFSDDEAEPTRSSPSGSGPSERPAGVSRRLIRWLVVSVTLIMLVMIGAAAGSAAGPRCVCAGIA